MKKYIILVISILLQLFIAMGVSASDGLYDTEYLPKVVTTKYFEDVYYHSVFDSELARMCRKLSSDTDDIALGDGDADAKNFLEYGFTDIQEYFVLEDDALNVGIYASNFLVGVKSFYVDGEEKHVLAIAFRGTKIQDIVDFTDVINDLKFYETYGFHSGFYTSAVKAYENLCGMKFDSLRNDDGSAMTFTDYLQKASLETDKYSILVTGHSMGGAIASIFAGDIISGFTVKNVTCYTFASPIVCTYEKSEEYDAYNIFNIINTEDVVPYVGVNAVHGVRLGTDLKVTVTDSEKHAHDLGETYEKATNQVIDNIESLYPNFYRKKYTVTENDTTVTKDELHICADCSLDEGFFDGHLGDTDLYIDSSTVSINTDIKTSGDFLMSKSDIESSKVHIDSFMMQIGGDFYQLGELNIGDAVVKVDGDYNKADPCVMEEEGASLLINGNFNGEYNGGWSGFFTATAGILEIKGDIVDFTGYRASGDHLLYLSGEKGQKIDMVDEDLLWIGQINNLMIANTSEEGVEFTDTAHVIGELYMLDSSKVINSSNLILTGSASVRDVWDGDLSASGWKSDSISIINGNLHIIGNIDKETIINGNTTVSGDLKVLSGISLKISGGEIEANNVTIEQRGSIIFTGSARMIVNGDLKTELTSELNIGPAEVIVIGNFNKSGKCVMDNNDGYFLINGNVIDSSNSFTATAGVLEIKGSTVHLKDYRPSETHKLIFSGTEKQEIDMAKGTGSLNAGKINTLEIANTSEEGVAFVSYVNVLTDILQPVGTNITGIEYVSFQKITAFVDNGELNADINVYNGNAENALPTWLDYKRYCKFEIDGDEAFTLNETVKKTSFNCDLYFSKECSAESPVVIVAFYDDDNRFVQMASKPVDVKNGKSDFSLNFENKPYSTYRIMILDSFANLNPLMAAK